MQGPEIKFGEAVLDNGKFGKRVVRFETGRLAQQAQGAIAAYLDEETMLLSATSAGKHPKDNFGLGKENSRNHLIANPAIAAEIEHKIKIKMGLVADPNAVVLDATSDAAAPAAAPARVESLSAKLQSRKASGA